MAPWETVPDAILNTSVWSGVTLQALERLSSEDPAIFCATGSNLNTFGIFVEKFPHNTMHGAAFAAIGNCGTSTSGDCVIGSLMSPRSTIFFQIHGLIETWHTRYRNECM